MTDTTYDLWFIIEGGTTPIEVTVPPTLTISKLKDAIFDRIKNKNTNFQAFQLILKKVCAIS